MISLMLTSCSLSSDLATKAMLAPCLAYVMAIPSPTPLLAPVISTHLPFKRLLSVLMLPGAGAKCFPARHVDEAALCYHAVKGMLSQGLASSQQACSIENCFHLHWHIQPSHACFAAALGLNESIGAVHHTMMWACMQVLHL